MNVLLNQSPIHHEWNIFEQEANQNERNTSVLGYSKTDLL